MQRYQEPDGFMNGSFKKSRQKATCLRKQVAFVIAALLLPFSGKTAFLWKTFFLSVRLF